MLLPSLIRRLSNREDRLLILERLHPEQMMELWNWYVDPERGNQGRDLTLGNLYVNALIAEGYTGSDRESGPISAFLLGVSGAATLLDNHGKSSPFPVDLELKDVFDAMKEFHFTSKDTNCGYPHCGKILEQPGIEEAISDWRTLTLILAASCHLPSPKDSMMMQTERMRFPFFIGVEACGVDVTSYRSEFGDHV